MGTISVFEQKIQESSCDESDSQSNDENNDRCPKATEPGLAKTSIEIDTDFESDPLKTSTPIHEHEIGFGLNSVR